MKYQCPRQDMPPPFQKILFLPLIIVTILEIFVVIPPCILTYKPSDLQKPHTYHQLYFITLSLNLCTYMVMNPGPSVRNIKACLLNTRSLRNKTSSFSDFVSSNDLDMIGVTETWLRSSDTQGLIDEITPAGFQLHHVPHRNKRGGGVAVFVRNDIDGVLYQTDQRDTFKHITVKLSERQSNIDSWYMSSSDLQTPAKANSLRNLPQSPVRPPKTIKGIDGLKKIYIQSTNLYFYAHQSDIYFI